MNERIKILAKQAYEDVIKNTPSFLVTKELYEQKFAELIVEECVAICQDTDGEDNIDARSGRQDCAVEIKEHFGVEE
jgi:hypothetical protein